MRYKFLNIFNHYDSDEMQFLFDKKFLDETWIFEYGSGVSFIWSDGSWQCVRTKKPPGGSRYIVCHCGGESGWVEDTGLIFNSKTKAEPGDDYHNNMNSKVFLEYFEDLLKATTEPSVFFMDNASYHKTQVQA